MKNKIKYDNAKNMCFECVCENEGNCTMSEFDERMVLRTKVTLTQ